MPYWGRCLRCNHRIIGETYDYVLQQFIFHFRKSHKRALKTLEEIESMEKNDIFIRRISKREFEIYQEAFKHSSYWFGVRMQRFA